MLTLYTKKKQVSSLGCACQTKDNKSMKACKECDFLAGEFGYRCKECIGKTYMHDEQCLDNCDGTGLAEYYPKRNAGECRTPFNCNNLVSSLDGSACQCPYELRRDGCLSCSVQPGSTTCTECEAGKTVVNGKCK
eukprot:m.352158 g.352158  ORF g.352158 m.352158 type:complete len:135 (+) comp57400_c0_seq1:247-651(+)